MPNRRKATMQDVDRFDAMNMLHAEKSEIVNDVAHGMELEVEESSFSDPGEDYSALYVGTKQVGYWPGY